MLARRRESLRTLRGAALPADRLYNQYLYVVPIVVPFVAFLFDRAERGSRAVLFRTVLDALVVVTAMWRVIGDVPFVSGHALFLSYALLSSRSRFARVSAGAVMLEVIYLKYFVWHDHVTATVGMILGAAAALCLRLPRRNVAEPFGGERDRPRSSGL